MAPDGQGEDVGSLTITIKYKEDSSGMLIGQCREFPFIIVKGKTLEELVRYVKRHIEVYVNTFPEEANNIIQAHGTHSEAGLEETETTWKHEKLTITIPTKG